MIKVHLQYLPPFAWIHSKTFNIGFSYNWMNWGSAQFNSILLWSILLKVKVCSGCCRLKCKLHVLWADSEILCESRWPKGECVHGREGVTVLWTHQPASSTERRGKQEQRVRQIRMPQEWRWSWHLRKMRSELGKERRNKIHVTEA